MEKYAKLMKGLEVCAGPDCCKDGCPYYGETTGAMTCRARLLRDAEIAINNEQALRESAEEEMARLHVDVDDLEAANNTIRAERDGMRVELANAVEMRRSVEAHRDAIERDREEVYQHRNKLIKENEELRKECDMVVVRCTVLQNEINALMRKIGKQEGETDRPSVCDKELVAEVGKLIAQAKYQEGRADTLAEIVARCSFGGGGRHE